jgi:hypothetical protein
MNMTVNAHSILILIAVIIFAVGFGVLAFGNPDGKFLWEDLLLGSTFFAAGHLI